VANGHSALRAPLPIIPYDKGLFNSALLLYPILLRKQDTKEVAVEFSQLAQKFDNSYLSEYAGLCFLDCAKCNEPSDFESYLKAARMFRKARENLKIKVYKFS
jgi:hypothetical protein